MVKELLIHTPPFDDENIESYLLRLAEMNFCTVKDLLSLLGLPTAYKIKIEKYLSPETITKIATLAGVTEDVIYHTSMKKYRELLIQRLNDQMYLSKYVIDCDTIRYCPACLSKTRYTKTSWQLLPIQYCLEHNHLLESKCPNCSKKIESFEELLNDQCSACSSSLSSEKNSTVPPFELLEVQRRLYDVLGIVSGPIEIHYPAGFSEGSYLKFYLYIKLLLSYSYKCIESLSAYINIEDSEIRNFYFINTLLSNWPYNFRKFLDDLSFKHEKKHRKPTKDLMRRLSLVECEYTHYPMGYLAENKCLPILKSVMKQNRTFSSYICKYFIRNLSIEDLNPSFNYVFYEKSSLSRKDWNEAFNRVLQASKASSDVEGFISLNILQ